MKILIKYLAIILYSSFPFIYLLFFVLKFGIYFPFWDQWELVPLLSKHYTGSLQFYDLWQVHNGHNIFFPKIVMLSTAILTGWNIRVELLLNLIIALLNLILFYYLMNLTNIKKRGKFFFLPILSFIIFSGNQWENFVWGWQLQIHLLIFFSLLSINLLLRSNFTSFKYIALASMSTILASYTFLAGITLWYLGLLLFLVHFFLNRVTHLFSFFFCIIFWKIISLITLYFYFYNNSFNYPIGLSFKNFSIFFFTLLGAPLSSYSAVGAFTLGFLGVILFICFLVLALKKMSMFKATLSFFAISFYSIFILGFISLGRGYLGTSQALVSRYTTFSQIFWIGILFIGYYYILFPISKGKFIKSISLLIISIIILIAISSVYQINTNFLKFYYTLGKAKESLISGKNMENLFWLYYSPHVVQQRINILKHYHLTIFK